MTLVLSGAELTIRWSTPEAPIDAETRDAATAEDDTGWDFNQSLVHQINPRASSRHHQSRGHFKLWMFFLACVVFPFVLLRASYSLEASSRPNGLQPVRSWGGPSADLKAL